MKSQIKVTMVQLLHTTPCHSIRRATLCNQLWQPDLFLHLWTKCWTPAPMRAKTAMKNYPPTRRWKSGTPGTRTAQEHERIGAGAKDRYTVTRKRWSTLGWWREWDRLVQLRGSVLGCKPWRYKQLDRFR